MKILVIEDNLIDQELLTKWFPEYDFTFCTNPLQAYALLIKDTKFDLCLCDYCLPMTVNDNVINKLRSSCNFPIVAYSAVVNDFALVPKEKEAIQQAIKDATGHMGQTTPDNHR